MARSFRIPEKGHTPQGSLTVAYEYVPELRQMLVGVAFCSPKEKSMIRKKGRLIAFGRLEHFKRDLMAQQSVAFGVVSVPWETGEGGLRVEKSWEEFRNNLSFIVETTVRGPRWYKEKFIPWLKKSTVEKEVK